MIKQNHTFVKFDVMHMTGFCSTHLTLLHYAVYMKKLDICKVILGLSNCDSHEHTTCIIKTGLCFHDGPQHECPVCSQCAIMGNLSPFLVAANCHYHQFYQDFKDLEGPETRWGFGDPLLSGIQRGLMSYCILGNEAGLELLNYGHEDEPEWGGCTDVSECHFAQ